jgi:hypothetical protein
LKIKRPLVTLAVGLLMAGICHMEGADAASLKPDVLLIVADDLRPEAAMR